MILSKGHYILLKKHGILSEKSTTFPQKTILYSLRRDPLSLKKASCTHSKRALQFLQNPVHTLSKEPLLLRHDSLQ